MRRSGPSDTVISIPGLSIPGFSAFIQPENTPCAPFRVAVRHG